ncbi:hypothetical protein B0A49_07962 [Cryomyces minteri]|uniref:NAD(P)-binding protein n=1 Tax=Cryomyces minteri TaxID=331657 RepID=A0A4U0WRX8_9PEZI|nr:hypothetical protein B0A49_07962 [Cryomyces minteri]
MPLTILADSDVRSLLHSLSRQDILDIQQSLADALHYYSTATEENSCCSSYQPQRTSLKRKDGSTTLFMPASSSDGLGMKIVTLMAPDDTDSAQGLSRLSLSSTESSARSSSPSIASSKTAASTSSSTTAADVPPLSISSAQSTTPRGSLTLLDTGGAPRAMINAEEVTAFRTALASMMLFKKRSSVHDVSVFGAGKQAYWHIRLALLLRGEEIHHLNIINRSFDRATNLIKQLYEPGEKGDYSANGGVGAFGKRTKFTIITPGHGEYDRLLKSHVRQSNVIICTTPSTSPLFPASYLTNTGGRMKGRYIALIGSYKPHMIELHPDILRQAVKPEHAHHHHKHAKNGGAIVVDSVTACLKEAGEIIQAGLKPNEVVELGELVMLKREIERRKAEGRHSDGDSENGVEVQTDRGLREWLEKGNVMYKSVGLGLMDVVVGNDLVRLADERGVGTRIENF